MGGDPEPSPVSAGRRGCTLPWRTLRGDGVRHGGGAWGGSQPWLGGRGVGLCRVQGSEAGCTRESLGVSGWLVPGSGAPSRASESRMSVLKAWAMTSSKAHPQEDKSGGHRAGRSLEGPDLWVQRMDRKQGLGVRRSCREGGTVAKHWGISCGIHRARDSLGLERAARLQATGKSEVDVLPAVPMV